MTYEEALQKINSRLRFGIKPGLERIEALCKKLGDPQKKPRFVHVAGTNGKGTTCTLIASVLTAAIARASTRPRMCLISASAFASTVK